MFSAASALPKSGSPPNPRSNAMKESVLEQEATSRKAAAGPARHPNRAVTTRASSPAAAAQPVSFVKRFRWPLVFLVAAGIVWGFISFSGSSPLKHRMRRLSGRLPFSRLRPPPRRRLHHPLRRQRPILSSQSLSNRHLLTKRSQSPMNQNQPRIPRLTLALVSRATARLTDSVCPATGVMVAPATG